LRGEIQIAGSKNVITKLMVAALLGNSPSEFTNVPRVGDVEITASILRDTGAEVEIDGRHVKVDPAFIRNGELPVRNSGLNRIPILLLGPLLHRLGEVFVPLVGGDAIGGRPVDYHLNALRQFGAEIQVSHNGVRAKARTFRGARIALPYPSVGATETVLLAGAVAEGRTVIENAAIEPEVVELALFLQRMGAGIELQPDRRFVIEGTNHLSGTRRQVGGDRIEAFSYLVACLVTGGIVRVTGCGQERLVTAISPLRRMGAHFAIDDDGITTEDAELHPIAVHTGTHPGFMTDWQPALGVLFTHETVFGDRAYVLAAAASTTPSMLTGIAQPERGYDEVAAKFRSLGLDFHELP
jgi:UDP-N-acetylglucosamine 1-carboxyvinyltransferase